MFPGITSATTGSDGEGDTEALVLGREIDVSAAVIDFECAVN